MAGYGWQNEHQSENDARKVLRWMFHCRLVSFFLYDQELTYTMDNPSRNPLFLLCVVRIERQERDNQMTTGVMQTELISDFRSFTSGQNWRI
jgi:hypothetical protein